EEDGGRNAQQQREDGSSKQEIDGGREGEVGDDRGSHAERRASRVGNRVLGELLTPAAGVRAGSGLERPLGAAMGPIIAPRPSRHRARGALSAHSASRSGRARSARARLRLLRGGGAGTPEGGGVPAPGTARTRDRSLPPRCL